ncbi:MAG: hypothetical protein ACP5I8_14985 [Phycisphaerae bacterium]
MDRRTFIGLIGAVSVGTTSGVGTRVSSAASSSGAQNPSSGLPRADDLAGEWMSFGDLHTLPTVNNTLGGAAVGADLLSIEALTFPAFAQGGSSGQMTVDGQILRAAQFRWYPYQVLRKGRSWDGNIELISAVRMSHQQRAVLFELNITNHSSTARTMQLEVPLQAMIRWQPDGWTWEVPRPDQPADFHARIAPGKILLIHDARSVAHVAFAFSGRQPEVLEAGPNHGVAQWHEHLMAGETRKLQLVMSVGSTSKDVLTEAAQAAGAFETAFLECQTQWQAMFDAAFQPGNKVFSGHLPTLHTHDADISRVYYMSVVSLLTMLRNCFSTAHRAYITAGPQWATSLMYFWDTFTWATLHALLDPVNMRKMLLRWLQLNIHSCYAQDMLTGHAVGPWYSFNDFVVFNQFLIYIRVTGDRALLEEAVGGRSVLDQLELMALWWKRLVKPYSPLADYGLAWNLLECVPTYTHVVASLNSANVWMMRQMADLRTQAGQIGRGNSLRSQADELARHVLKLYVPGTGYWNTIQPDGQRIAVRHCVDFFTICYCMESDLSYAMRQQMARFVKTELLTDHWMRALSLSDPAAPESNRPDHGPMGAYDAWPPFTVDALGRLGHWSSAVDFLKRCAYTTREGPYGQAHELLTARRDAPVRKAIRGGQAYNESCSGAFADVIIRTLFGFQCNLDGNPELMAANMDRRFVGRLEHVRAAGKLWMITSGPEGLELKAQQ